MERREFLAGLAAPAALVRENRAPRVWKASVTPVCNAIVIIFDNPERTTLYLVPDPTAPPLVPEGDIIEFDGETNVVEYEWGPLTKPLAPIQAFVTVDGKQVQVAGITAQVPTVIELEDGTVIDVAEFNRRLVASFSKT